MYCDLCGKETNKLYKINLENTVVFACSDCRSFGKTIASVDKLRKSPPQNLNLKSRNSKKSEKEETTEIIIDGYGKIIHEAREKKDIAPKDFAKLLGIKESLLLKIESSHYEPTIKVAKRIENLLSITLVNKIKNASVAKNRTKDADVTLGDFVKIKKRKSQNF